MKFEIELWEVPEWTEEVAFRMFRRQWMDGQVRTHQAPVEDPEGVVRELWGVKDTSRPWYGLAGEAMRCLKGYERCAMIQRKADLSGS